jgi:DNA recombination protein RmuC
MEVYLLVAVFLLGVATLAAVLLSRRGSAGSAAGAELSALAAQAAALEKSLERVERALHEEMALGRREASDVAQRGREELSGSLKQFQDSVLARVAEIAGLQASQLEAFAKQLGAATQANQQSLESLRQTIDSRLTEQFSAFAQQLAQLTESNRASLEELRQTLERKLTQLATEAGASAAQTREELAKRLKEFSDAFAQRSSEIAAQQKTQLQLFADSLAKLTTTNEQKLEGLRQTIELKLGELQKDNAAKLEQMRLTVDEKLHATLETRLGESFKLVSDRLELVHKGLGEMQHLASGVGDLKKVLSNIKTRGTWGEVQLGNLLSQLLTPDQFAQNVQVNPASGERVEFAVKLPGRGSDDRCIWLPIDAKFPQEDYQRLVDASERGDADAVTASVTALEARVCGEAKKIREKYICPPHTTDFAVLFLPTEGLFAEVLRRPGLCDGLLHDHRVVVTGPTTLAAVLSSLQMGFRTLAIEKRSSEVWQVLSAVKTEFSKFGEVLEKVDKKLHEASNVISDAKVRKRAVERQLKEVASAPEDTLQLEPLQLE